MIEKEREKDKVLRENIVDETAAMYLGKREVTAEKKDSIRFRNFLMGLGKSTPFMFSLIL